MSFQPSPAEPGEILTFYSYKGGTGRSMVLANTACLLAQRSAGYENVLVVDWDLEAPGLHRYFADRFHRQFENPETAAAALDRHPGLIDLFSALAAEIDKLPPIAEEPGPEVQEQLGRAVNFESYVLKTDVPNVSMLKAGAFDENYAKRVNTFAWEPLYNRAPWAISLVAEWFTSRYRYTLIDSRTGITDTSGICTMLLPDKLVTVFTPNQQSLDGVIQMAERSTNYRRRSADLRPLSVFPLPSRIEASEPELKERWRKGVGLGYQPRFEALFRKVWELEECNLEAYFNEVQIQHASAYAYGEKIAVLLEKSNDLHSLRRAYTSFVERLALDEPWDVPVAGAVSAVAGAVADFAESAYAQLKPSEQDAAKRLFLQLVRVPQEASRPTARERGLNVLTEDAQSVVPAFVAAKVLSLRESDAKTVVFLADESLVFTWRRLLEWVAADLEFLRWRDALDAAKANWDKFGSAKEGLLRGLPLQEAETRLAARAADLNVAEVAYIRASVAGRRRGKILQWSLGVAAGLVAVIALAVVIALKDQSLQAQAQAILEQGGLVAAIRAQRLYPGWKPIESHLRTLLNQLPQPVAVLPNSSGGVAAILFNEDGTRLAVNYSDHVTAFSWKSGEPTVTFPMHLAQSFAFSPDGKWLAVGDVDGTRILRNQLTGVQHSVPFGKPVTAIAFSPDGSRIATGTAGGDIYLSTIPDTKTIHLTHQARVNVIAFSPNGRALASASDDRTAMLWTADSGRNFAILEHVAPVKSVLYTPDGKYVVTASSDGAVRFWLSGKDAPALATFSGLMPGTQITFSPDGRYLGLVTDLSVGLVDAASLKWLRSLAFPVQIVSFAFGQGNGTLAAGADGAIYYGPSSGKWIPDDRLKTLAAGGIAFSKDGSEFAVQSKAGPIVVYKPDTAPDTSYQSLTGSALADAACQKLKPLAAIEPDYPKACP